MTLQDLKDALDRIVARGDTDVVVVTKDFDGDFVPVAITLVEKVGARIMVHIDA